MALEAARKARQIVHFAEAIGSQEPVLRMDLSLRRWSIASNAGNPGVPDCYRLRMYEGEPTLNLVEYYLQKERSNPTTSLIMAGLRYRELQRPGVSDIRLPRIWFTC
jgi:hypothetical protein